MGDIGLFFTGVQISSQKFSALKREMLEEAFGTLASVAILDTQVPHGRASAKSQLCFQFDLLQNSNPERQQTGL